MGCTMSVEDRKREERWRAEADMETLMRADEIRSDQKRLKAAQALAKEKLEQVAVVVAAEPKKA
jgi:hypothetical protein